MAEINFFHSVPIGRLPPADNRAEPFKPESFQPFDLSDPMSQTGCVMDNKGSAVCRQDIVLQAVEINGFLNVC